jgi:pimeloyl-ACP methyl ester carboxylesterase
MLAHSETPLSLNMSGAFLTKEPLVRSADGTRIWAASAGRSAIGAPTIVFVPGFSSSSLTFRKQFEDEDLLNKYCLVNSYNLDAFQYLLYDRLLTNLAAKADRISL